MWEWDNPKGGYTLLSCLTFYLGRTGGTKSLIFHVMFAHTKGGRSGMAGVAFAMPYHSFLLVCNAILLLAFSKGGTSCKTQIFVTFQLTTISRQREPWASDLVC